MSRIYTIRHITHVTFLDKILTQNTRNLAIVAIDEQSVCKRTSVIEAWTTNTPISADISSNDVTPKCTGFVIKFISGATPPSSYSPAEPEVRWLYRTHWVLRASSHHSVQWFATCENVSTSIESSFVYACLLHFKGLPFLSFSCFCATRFSLAGIGQKPPATAWHSYTFLPPKIIMQ